MNRRIEPPGLGVVAEPFEHQEREVALLLDRNLSLQARSIDPVRGVGDLPPERKSGGLELVEHIPAPRGPRHSQIVDAGEARLELFVLLGHGSSGRRFRSEPTYLRTSSVYTPMGFQSRKPFAWYLRAASIWARTCSGGRLALVSEKSSSH